MRVCELTDEQLRQLAVIRRRESLASPARTDGERFAALACAEAIDELLDRRAAMAEMAVLERSLAFEQATQIIEGSCRPVGDEEDDCRVWWDSVNGACELAADSIVEARCYLESRGLIEVHATQPTWIAIKDESEAAA